MGVSKNELNASFIKFIQKQSVFFVATAASAGKVNLSPKGLDSLRIVNTKQIVWLSVTGSGNETAAHVISNSRMTLMFCAFEGSHMILRVYGSARVVYPYDKEWDDLYSLFPRYAGARNIFKLDIDTAATSCGSGVPEMSITRTRAETDLVPWYAEMGAEGVEKFWRKKNMQSIDGLPTGILHSEKE